MHGLSNRYAGKLTFIQIKAIVRMKVRQATFLEFQDKHKTHILTTFPLIFHKAISFRYFLKLKLSHSVKAGTNRQDFDLNIYFLLIHNRSLHL